MNKRILIIGNILSFFIFAFIVSLVFTSCGEKKEKETIIIEKQVEKPKAEESDGTSLSVDKNGVEFSTKNGDKKTEVKIND
jgi:hypothetical protein